MRIKIIVDRREKNPWKFEWFNHVMARKGTLKTGDYSIVGGSASGVVVERKSLQDLFGSMSSGRGRFRRELNRMGKFKRAFLLIEAPVSSFIPGSPWTGISGKLMIDTLYRWCLALGITPIFSPSRVEAERTCFLLLKAYSDSRGLRGR